MKSAVELALLSQELESAMKLGKNMPPDMFQGLESDFDTALAAADPLLRSRILASLAKDTALSEYIINALWLAA